MKKIISFALLFVCLLMGCASTPSNLPQLSYDMVDSIQIISAMGNPALGAESKTITDPDTLHAFVDSFNRATIGDKIPEDEVGVAMTSKYIFFKDGEAVQTISCNGNDCERLARQDGYYVLHYADDTTLPWTLYQIAPVDIVLVDLAGKPLP